MDYTFALTMQDLSGPEWKKFIENVKRANAEVAALKSPIESTASATGSMVGKLEAIKSRIDGVVSGAKGLVALWAGNEAVQWARRTAAAADETQQLAKSLGFTADQVQAMQIAAAKNGTTLEQQATFYSKNRDLLDEMTEAMRRQGMIMSGPTRQGFADVNLEIEKVGRTWDALRASFGDTGMVGQGISVIASMIRDVGVSLAYVETYRGTVGLIREIGAIITGGGGLVPGGSAPERAAQFLGGLKKDALEAEAAVQKLEVQLRQLPPEPANAPRGGRREGAMIRSERGEVTAQLDAARKVRDEANAAVERAEAAIAKAESITRTAQSPLYIPTGRTADQLMGLDLAVTGGVGGGGGGGSRDRIGENLQLYEDQAKAAERTLADLRKVAALPLPLDDLTRQIKLTKDIADAEAQARKFAKDDPRIPQLREWITRRETANAAEQEFTNTLKFADATQRQYGDGQLALLTGTKQLNDARDQGRLTIDAHALALLELTRSTEDLRLKNIGLADGLPALAAGWQDAQNRFIRANNTFAVGGRVFDLVMTGMDQSLKQFVTTGRVDLASFAGDFFLTIAQMEARLAMSSLWSAGSGVLGSVLGSVASGIGNLFGGFSWDGMASGSMLDALAGEAARNVLSGLPGRAGGGPVSAGMSYIVGERGPELFQPRVDGSIVNRQQLRSLGVGGGSGVSVTVYQTNHFGSDVSRAELETRLVQMSDSTRKAAIAGTMDAISRGGNARTTVRT